MRTFEVVEVLPHLVVRGLHVVGTFYELIQVWREVNRLIFHLFLEGPDEVDSTLWLRDTKRGAS